jgi:hypothetical protein
VVSKAWVEWPVVGGMSPWLPLPLQLRLWLWLGRSTQALPLPPPPQSGVRGLRPAVVGVTAIAALEAVAVRSPSETNRGVERNKDGKTGSWSMQQKGSQAVSQSVSQSVRLSR